MNVRRNKNLALVGLDIFDEFEGSEVETKFEFCPREPDLFIRLFKKKIEESNNGIFKLVPGKKEILGWTYYFDRYGCRKGSGLIEAYVLIYHPEKEKFWIKVKGMPESKKSESEFLMRKESIVRIERKMTEMDSDLILKLKTEEVGKKVIFLGTIKRYKVYLLLQNSGTGRYYSVSADRCHYKKFILSQIEIEYKGVAEMRRISTKLPLLRKFVGQEIFMLSDFLIESMGGQFQLKKTNKTKFEWLCSCLNQEKK